MATEYYAKHRFFSAPRRKSRVNQTSADEKKKIAKLVRERELLWNLKHPLNKDSNAQDQAWQEISEELDKPKNVCKLSWKALMDCYRYRNITAFKLRERGEIDDPKEYIKANWEFAEDLEFLSYRKRPNRHYIKLVEEEDDHIAAVQDDTSTNSCAVEGNYVTENDPISADIISEENMDGNIEADVIDESSAYPFDTDNNTDESKSNQKFDDVVHQLGKLVLAQTDLVREFKDSFTGKLSFKTQLTALDALLQQLPKNHAEKTLVEMQNYVLKKINEHQKNKSEFD